MNVDRNKVLAILQTLSFHQDERLGGKYVPEAIRLIAEMLMPEVGELTADEKYYFNRLICEGEINPKGSWGTISFDSVLVKSSWEYTQNYDFSDNYFYDFEDFKTFYENHIEGYEEYWK